MRLTLQILCFAACAAASWPPAAPSGPGTLRQTVADADLGWPPPDVRLTIDKSDRRMQLYSGERLLKTYRVGLAGPELDKVREGDLATPEGTFQLVTRNAKSSYHLFLGINYPLAEDANRGEKAGMISKAQATAIREADTAGRVPPWNTRLGGMIGIHGGGGSADWTLGCIAVENSEIEEIWAVTKPGTTVTIQR
ncbi:MAG: murein L,D-transpeptidase YafK [Kiritimatiellia bacterium]|jgi:murein L,D-transpeptidase YafK